MFVKELRICFLMADDHANFRATCFRKLEDSCIAGGFVLRWVWGDFVHLRRSSFRANTPLSAHKTRIKGTVLLNYVVQHKCVFR